MRAKNSNKDLAQKGDGAKAANLHLTQNSEIAGTGASSPLTRRTFLGGATVSAAVSITGVGVRMLGKQAIESEELPRISSQDQLSGAVGGTVRRVQAFRTRLKTAIAGMRVP